MKCVVCSGDVRPAKVTEDLDVGPDHVLVEVEAEVCERCGERYYTEETLDHLMDLRDRMRGGDLSVTEIGKVYRLTA